MSRRFIRTKPDYCKEASTLFATFATAAAPQRKLLIDRVIRQLVGGGIWAKLDCLYIFAAADSAAALINWKTPGTFNAALVNAPSFTADQGFTGNGTTSYVESNFNPSTAGGNFVQDSASFGVWNRTSGQSVASAAGWFDGTDGITILPRSTTDVFSGRIVTSSSENFVTSVTDGTGFSVMDRSASNVTNGYRNGAVGSAGSAASAALNNASFRFGSITAASFSVHQFAAGVIGGSLTAANHASLYAAVLVYMQAVGAA